ncbi:MAG: AAA family ATPase [Muribaculaceae bacterium]
MHNNHITPPAQRYAIVIGRTYGSGGRALGRMIAERLGIAYYDKELLEAAARHGGVSTDYLERRDERTPRVVVGFMPANIGISSLPCYSLPSGGDAAYTAISDAVTAAVSAGPCVIVGRTADYVLRHSGVTVVSIFVHAPIEVCARRIMQRGECDNAKTARDIAERANKLRAAYYNFYTDRKWGDAAEYDLTIDSSRLPLEQLADIVIDYTRRRLAADAAGNNVDKQL